MLVTCPHCGGQANGPNNDPRPMRCPHCGGVFQSTAPPPAPVIPKKPPKPVESLPQFQQLGDEEEDRSTRRRKQPIPPEPWYYGFLSMLAAIWIILGLLSVFIGTAYQIHLLSELRNPPTSAVMLVIAAFLLGLFIVFFWDAIALILLDVARNIRITRYNTR